MRAYLPEYDLRRAESLDDALALLAAEPGAWRPFAGGTDLMVLLESGVLPRGRYLSIWNLSELRGIVADDREVSIGALTTYSEVRDHAVLEREYPLLGRAARETGGLAIQNRGTLGGNIANASPAADTPPSLLVYDAELELRSVRGARRVPYATFHRGYKQMDLAPDELIARIILPRGRRGWREEYRKVGTRGAQAISKVCFAAAATVQKGVVEDVRLAYGSVAPIPLRCTRTEAVVRGHAIDAALLVAAERELLEEISPIDDIRSTAAYRRRVSANLLAGFLQRCAASG
jgi:CO/xanthine dehydrogenase FAD-binding subunit